MSRLLLELAAVGRDASFHCFLFATACTGLAICLTAGDLGPFAPLLISQGIFLIFLALLVEVFWWSRIGISALACRMLAKRNLQRKARSGN